MKALYESMCQEQGTTAKVFQQTETQWTPKTMDIPYLHSEGKKEMQIASPPSSLKYCHQLLSLFQQPPKASSLMRESDLYLVFTPLSIHFLRSEISWCQVPAGLLRWGRTWCASDDHLRLERHVHLRSTCQDTGRMGRQHWRVHTPGDVIITMPLLHNYGYHQNLLLSVSQVITGDN